ncbi:MAG: MOSC domain-containing protein [Sphingopyxis sp.]|nr:MOSC domain-containing protein [Sphingopyxis sp.]
MMTSTLDALLIGTPQRFHPARGMSSMARTSADHPVVVGPLGFVGDQVADPTVHGGPDKAVHFYPREHYAAWIADLGDHPRLAAPGGFGENLSASGLTEDRVCIGDRFRIGTALFEVAQGRQPCWKLDHHFGLKTMAADVIHTGRGGLYFRVIEDGEVAPGDIIVQVERGPEQWTVARVFHLLIGGGHKSVAGQAALAELAALPMLAATWRARAAKLRKVA